MAEKRRRKRRKMSRRVEEEEKINLKQDLFCYCDKKTMARNNLRRDKFICLALPGHNLPLRDIKARNKTGTC